VPTYGISPLLCYALTKGGLATTILTVTKQKISGKQCGLSNIKALCQILLNNLEIKYVIRMNLKQHYAMSTNTQIIGNNIEKFAYKPTLRSNIGR